MWSHPIRPEAEIKVTEALDEMIAKQQNLKYWFGQMVSRMTGLQREIQARENQKQAALAVLQKDDATFSMQDRLVEAVSILIRDP